MNNIFIVDTEVANIASVKASMSRLNVDAILTQDVLKIQNAQALILPGVGAFGAGMEKLRGKNLVEALRERIQSGLPTFAICLGMQLLCAASEESPGIEGLKILGQSAKRFSGELRVPHFGWNSIVSDNQFFGEGYAYFANSYRLTEAPKGWDIAWCDYGGPFVAGIKKEAVIATQFHPELSGAYGESIFAKWLKEYVC